ncbi:MAG TPA: 3'(2'),5'-bisphosphate nucleotidase [bacterium]|nr:3'(2'),5'-bisphosphate nucleotidase [bacterium]
MESHLQTVLEAVRRAALLCETVADGLTGEDTARKEDRSPVTVADFGSQALIIHALRKAFPREAVVAEEDTRLLRKDDGLLKRVSEAVQSVDPSLSREDILTCIDGGDEPPDFHDVYWTLDPIDGTKGFLRGDQYAVALAKIDQGQVCLAVLACPRFSLNEKDTGTGSLAWAVRGKGAWIRSLTGKGANPLRVDSVKDPRNARFCESWERGHGTHEVHEGIAARLGISRPSLRMDSQAKYLAVARGDVSLYLRLARGKAYREKIWDHAAGALLVAEAGGRVTDFASRTLDFSQGRRLENHVGILVSNGHWHDVILDAVRAETGGSPAV